jgi:hypothetical protein
LKLQKKKTERKSLPNPPPRLPSSSRTTSTGPTSAADFVTLQNGLQSFLNNVDSIVEGAVSASKAKLPIVEKSIGELTETTQALTDFKTNVDAALTQIGKLTGNNL